MHALTPLDKFRKKHSAHELTAFLADVQRVYSGDLTFEKVALRWGFLSKTGKPAPRLAWEMSRALFELRVVPKPETLEFLEMHLHSLEDEARDVREHGEHLRKAANVYRLK